jgi:hypothetical protein
MGRKDGKAVGRREMAREIVEWFKETGFPGTAEEIRLRYLKEKAREG